MSSTSCAGTPYILWIHCNRCYETFSKKERKCFLLACQHINCESCLVEVKQDINGPRVFKCRVCQKVTRSSEINNTMPANLKQLFHPEPYLDGLNSSLIVKFQAGHRRRYMEYLDRRQNSIKEVEKMTEKCKDLCKKTFQELHQLKAERKQLEKRLLSIKQQRKDADDNRQSKSLSMSSSSSSATSSSIHPRNIRSSPGHKSNGITSFSELTPKNSFLL